MNRLREALESERESWLAHQTQALLEKEREVRAEAKRERDRHIEAAIRKLDQESVDKQQILENKIMLEWKILQNKIFSYIYYIHLVFSHLLQNYIIIYIL